MEEEANEDEVVSGIDKKLDIAINELSLEINKIINTYGDDHHVYVGLLARAIKLLSSELQNQEHLKSLNDCIQAIQAQIDKAYDLQDE